MFGEIAVTNNCITVKPVEGITSNFAYDLYYYLNRWDLIYIFNETLILNTRDELFL